MEITFEQLPKAVTQLFDKISNIERLLTERATTAVAQPLTPISIDDAAKFLGLSRATMYGLNNQRKVKYFMQGKKCYYFESDLIDYLKQGKVKTLAEISAEADQYLNKRKGGKNGN